MMMDLLRALSAENLKLKRTLALWLAPLAALVIIGLQLAIVWDGRVYYLGLHIEDAWRSYSVGLVMMLWNLLMLPLFITLETALLANLEHANGGYKHLYALPVSRWSLYGAKLTGAAGIIGLSALVLYGGLVGSGLLLRHLVPGLGFEAPIPWAEYLRIVGASYLTSLLLISIHTWVAARWPSFVIASATGIVAMVVGVVVLQSRWAPWYPWTLPAVTWSKLSEGEGVRQLVLSGVLGGAGVALLGGAIHVRRDAL